MSYILDALRKAERERGISRASVLLDVPEPPRTYRRLILLAGAAICGTVALWFTLPALIRVIQPPPSPAPPASARLNSIPPTSEPGDSAALQTARPETPASPAGEAEVTRGHTLSPSAGAKPSSPSGSAPKSVSPGASVADQHTSDSSTVAASPTQSVPAAPAVAQPPGLATAQPAGITAATGVGAPPTVTPDTKPASLKEAISKMTLTLIRYSEVESERFVFINGRRYAKGDRVDDLYLIEDITLEGAVLSYNGERLLLKR